MEIKDRIIQLIVMGGSLEGCDTNGIAVREGPPLVEDFIKNCPAGRIFKPEIVTICRKDSSLHNDTDRMILANEIAQKTKDGTAAIVVIHGPGTVDVTIQFLKDNYPPPEVPVVFCGSEESIDTVDYPYSDAPVMIGRAIEKILSCPTPRYYACVPGEI